MTEEKFCQYCTQSRRCRQVWRQLGHIKGPSVAFGVVAAFLLPLVVFIISLAVFEGILSGFEIAADLRAVFSTVASVLVTTLFVLITRASTPPNKLGG